MAFYGACGIWAFGALKKGHVMMMRMMMVCLVSFLVRCASLERRGGVGQAEYRYGGGAETEKGGGCVF
jgi:hypothetical protein